MSQRSPTTTAGSNALKFLKKWPGDHRVAVGLSGGVDSSLSAALLVDAGWHVEGLTLWLMSGKGSCCADGLVDAASICEELGIDHHIVDSRTTFQREILERVVHGYKQGITPIPCSRCNRSVKFSTMLKWAEEERSLSFLATGHYARIKNAQDITPLPIELPGNSIGRHKLLRGLDEQKDQSYFLYDLPQETLGKVIFPLGELTKANTREEASRYNLRTAKKAESQDFCLAEHHGSMRAFLDAYLPPRIGEIILEDGTVVGQHDGIEHFTIGQRKGLGVAWREPLHVIRLDASTNRVVVAPRDDIAQSSCVVKAVNWVSIEPPQEAIEVEVQVRYRSCPVEALLIPLKPLKEDIQSSRPHRCRLKFRNNQFSITPGQAAVFYSNEFVLGGGLICQNE